MQQLKAQVQACSTRDNYDLDGKSIRDVAAYIPLLAKLKNLKRLSMRNNEITYLPGSLVTLKGLQELDMSDNPLKDVMASVAVLKGLPQLKELSLRISNKEEQDLLVRNLPGLEYLNGKSVNRTNQPRFTPDSVQVSIDSEYLLKISQLYDGLNRRLLAKEESSKRVSFNQHIQRTFMALTEGLELAGDNSNLATVRTMAARMSMSTFCLDTLAECLRASGEHDLSEALRTLTTLIAKDHSIMESLSIVLMKDKIDTTVALRTEEYERLSHRIEQLRRQNQQLESQLRDLQTQNSTYLNRIIQHSKGVALQSAGKLSETRLLSYSSGLEIPTDKKLTQLQVQELIGEIYQTKRKQQDTAGRCQPMKSYIEKFFAWKFGIEAISAFYQRLFSDCLAEYSASRSNWILTFIRIRSMECEQSYVEEQWKVQERLKKVIRRAVAEHQPALTDTELTRVMNSKIYDFYPNNNMKLEQATVVAVLNIVYPQEQATEIKSMLEEHMWSERRKRLEGSKVSKTDSPSKNSYIFRPPVPISTPSPRSKASPSKTQIKSLTYKRLINTIMNVELQKHLERLRKPTLLFIRYDEAQEGVISFSKLIDLLHDQQLETDNQLLRVLGQYVQETNPTRRQPTQQQLYELMAEGDMNIQITYSRFIDFAKKKCIRNKALLDLINRRDD